MTTIDPSLIHVRGFAPTDEAYLYATWLRGLYADSPWSLNGRDNFFRAYHAILERIITSPLTRIKILALNDDPDVILAYAIHEPKPPAQILHWVYTRKAWRRMGLATMIVGPLGVTEVTHLTTLGKSIKPEAWAFNPMMPYDQKTEVES